MPRNPHITPEASAAALAGTFPGHLGIEVTDIDERAVHARMAVDARHLHPGGYVHGGCWVAFADTVAAWGTMANLPEQAGFTTVELKTNVFTAGLPGDVLLAEGTPLHLGPRTQVWQVQVLRVREGAERPAAHFVCTQLVL